MKLNQLFETTADSYLVHAYLRADDGDGDDHADMRYDLEDVIAKHGAKVVRETNGDPLVWEIKVPAAKIEDLCDEIEDSDLVTDIETNEKGPFKDNPFADPVSKLAGDNAELQAKIEKRLKK